MVLKEMLANWAAVTSDHAPSNAAPEWQGRRLRWRAECWWWPDHSWGLLDVQEASMPGLLLVNCVNYA